MKKCEFCDNSYNIKGIGTHRSKCKMNPNRTPTSKNHGGYRPGSGKGLSGWYNGIYCDSSWELAYVLYCNMHEIPVKRYDGEYLEYFSDDGNIHKYIPDFIINHNQIIEIKGWLSEDAKIKSFQYPNIVVLLKPEMELILQQIKFKYGSNFTELYNGIISKKIKIKTLKKVKIVSSRQKVKEFTECVKCKKLFKYTKHKNQKYCSSECYQDSTRKFKITFDELNELVWKYPTSKIALIYEVSDKAIEKRCKLLGIEKPPRGYWQKKK